MASSGGRRSQGWEVPAPARSPRGWVEGDPTAADVRMSVGVGSMMVGGSGGSGSDALTMGGGVMRRPPTSRSRAVIGSFTMSGGVGGSRVLGGGLGGCSGSLVLRGGGLGGSLGCGEGDAGSLGFGDGVNA